MTELPDAFNRNILTERTISHGEARGCAQRLINSFFHNPNGATARIPADKDNDDDLVLMAYLAQQERAALASSGLADAQKQITELTAALYLTKRNKEDAIAVRTTTIEALRERLREAVKALEFVRDEGMLNAHTAHWDRTGGSGAGCLACHANRAARDRIHVALARIKGEPT